MPPKKEETKTTTARKTPARKTATTKTTAAKKTPATRKAPVKKTAASSSTVAKQVAANARHIEENHQIAQNNSKLIHILYGAIILLMMIIAGLAFYIGTKLGNISVPENTSTVTTPVVAEDVVVTVIDDSRCSDCQTDAIETQIKALPFLSAASFERKDFSDTWVADYLKENKIMQLPAIIFNTNKLADGGQITPYLVALLDGDYSLALGATFNPFAKRSENGFLMAEQDMVNAIKEDAHFIGDENAKITWIEYTDVNCHYCKKMEQDGTAKTVLEKFPETLNKTSSNFIGVGGAATQKAAEILECAAVSGGSKLYNSLLSEVLISGNNSEEAMLSFISEKGGNKDTVKACLDNGESKETVSRKFTRGQAEFGITGTPGNVILNNETGEYEVISGAYPAEKFIEVIEKMSK